MNKFSLLGFSFLLLLLPVTALAQNAVSFSVSPTIFDMTGNPGQTWRSSVRVINANPYELRLSIDVNNFVPKGESGTPRFIPIDELTDLNSTLAQWITTEGEIVVAPEQTVEIPITITLPSDAPPGGHFAALMISTKSGSKKATTSVQTSQIITSLIFLRVTGDISENSTIRSFRTTHAVLSKPEATFELRIENKGNVHVQPQGEIKIYNMWGKERGAIPVNQQTLFGNVFPNSVRKYSFTWSSEWSISDIGRYTAKVALAYGTDGRQFMTADTAFWIIPWKILLAIFIVVGSFLALVSWAIKAYVRRMLKLAGIGPNANYIPVSNIEQISINVTIQVKSKKSISVVAPIEAGILDLRVRLTKTDTLKAAMATILAFMRSYWKFFVVLFATLLFLAGAVWFFVNAFAPSRDYEVTIDGKGQNIKVTSESADTTKTAPEVISQPDFLIKIVNRSGNEQLTEVVSGIVEREGKKVSESSVDLSTVEERTVIVYTPEYADVALRLSTLLNNALLSAYIPEAEVTPELVIYIGSDLETE